jgi:sugar lactone lactonase YvrE
MTHTTHTTHMPGTTRARRGRVRGFALSLLTCLALTITPTMPGPPAAGATSPDRIDRIVVLPGASSAEGIAEGRGSTFYAGDYSRGDIFRGDVRRRTAELFIDVPAGRQALGMVVDERHHLLFVAGGATGQAYVYDLDTGATLATYQLAPPDTSIVNDVTLTPDGVWFTDSLRAHLYFVPIDPHGTPGPARTRTVTGPAADTSGAFNLNGIRATPDGRTLVVAHFAHGAVYTVDPATGTSAPIAGASVPNVDGILLEAGRLWAVQSFDNQVTRIDLAPDLRSGEVEAVLTSDRFQVPTTAARFGHHLAVVNAKFDTGVPPTATRFEIVIVGS